MKAWSKETIREKVRSKDIKFILLQFTDLNGQLKNIEIPISQLHKALDNQIMFDGSSIDGFCKIEESDMYLYPDLSTWMVLPHESDEKNLVARLICDIYTPYQVPFEGDPRGILKKAIQEAEELGYSLNVGPEPEFFLFKKDEKGKATPVLNDSAGYFDTHPTDTGVHCRRDIVTTLESMGYVVEASHHEVAIGQHEIDFEYSDALRTADNIQTFKSVVKSVADKHNLYATFMAKPVFGINGSGMHCNLSLSENGENIFFDMDTANQLSDTANYFIAGIMAHAKATAAITNPTVNSYKRIIPGYEAPVNIAWSTSNRTCMIRIPAKRGSATRVEVRNPDPSANPYLAIAVLLKAGLDGIKQKMELPKEQKQNLYELPQAEKDTLGIDSLPSDLAQALNYLESDSVIREALGTHAYESFIELKKAEWQEYILSVTEWEKTKYLGV